MQGIAGIRAVVEEEAREGLTSINLLFLLPIGARILDEWEQVVRCVTTRAFGLGGDTAVFIS